MDRNLLSDDELLSCVDLGCVESFDELINRYEGRILALVSYLLDDQSASEDVLVEVFSALAQGREGRPAQISVYAWLCAQAISAVVTRRTATAGAQLVVERERVSDRTISREVRAAACTERAAFVLLLRRLPFEYRCAFLLNSMCRLSAGEISTVLSISLSDTTMTLNRARLMIRRCMKRLPNASHEAEQVLTPGAGALQPSALV